MWSHTACSGRPRLSGAWSRRPQGSPLPVPLWLHQHLQWPSEGWGDDGGHPCLLTFLFASGPEILSNPALNLLASCGSRLQRQLPAVSINIYFSLSETNLLVWRVPQVILLQDLVADSSVLAWSVALIEPTLWLRVPVDIFSRNLITSFV